MKNCKSCGIQNQKNAKFCSECGEKFVLSVTEQEKEYKRKVADALESNLNSIRSGVYINDVDQFKGIIRKYREEVYDLIKFQEENFDTLIDEFISTQHEVRDYYYYQARMNNGQTFDEILEEEEVLKDIYFTNNQKGAIKNCFNPKQFLGLKESFIIVNQAVGRTYSKKGEEPIDGNSNNEESTDLLEIADAALAFLSPVSAARYIIKQMREND